MRETFNDIMSKSVQKPPQVHDSFHGTTVQYWEGGRMVKVEMNEKFKMKSQHDMNIRKILEEPSPFG